MTKPSSCLGCPLQSHGHDFSAVEGLGKLGVMAVAEASGEMEARDGLPLRPYAPAGMIFERTLRRLGIDRQAISVTNMLRCRPRDNKLAGMSYESVAVSHCKSNLEATFMERKPKVILALGQVPHGWLTGNYESGMTVSELRGYVFKLDPNYSQAMADEAELNNTVVLSTYHPSFLRRGNIHLSGVFARDVMRAMKIAQGQDFSFILDDPLLAVYRGELEYELKPSLDDAWSFYRAYAEGSPQLDITYDLETRETTSLAEDAREEFQDTQIRQIQFMVGTRGIAVPWTKEYQPFIIAMMRLPNRKIGWNNEGFDNRVLAAVGEAQGEPGVFKPQGRVIDAMQMWKRWQPELPANLQYAATFVQWPFPWKHLSGKHLPFYGVCDVDATGRIFHMLEKSMGDKGILDSYYTQVADLAHLPAQVAKHGLELDREAGRRIFSELTHTQEAIQAEMELVYPNDLRTYSPEEGYKKTPAEVKDRMKLWDAERLGVLIGEKTVREGESRVDYVMRMTGMIERTFIAEVKDPATLRPVKTPVERWCKVNPVSPNSRQQIIKYAKLKKHEVPQAKDKYTGEKKDSLTLEDIDLMAGRTKDKFYKLIGAWRRAAESKRLIGELDLMAARSPMIHPVFKLQADGRLGASNPSLPELGSLASKMIKAREGHQFVRWSWEGQVERIIMELSGAPAIGDDFYQAAYDQLGIHPAALKGFLLGQTNRTILDANRLVFGASLKTIMDMRTKWDKVRPQVIRWQYAQCDKAHKQLSLVSSFGEIRWFYEVMAPDGKGGLRAGEQYESAARFIPEAEAMGRTQARLKMLGHVYLAAIHRDWIMFEAPNHVVKDHIKSWYSRLTPSGVYVGANWHDMQKVEVK